MSNFTATWMLIAEWEDIQQYGSSADGVSYNQSLKLKIIKSLTATYVSDFTLQKVQNVFLRTFPFML